MKLVLKEKFKLIQVGSRFKCKFGVQIRILLFFFSFFFFLDTLVM